MKKYFKSFLVSIALVIGFSVATPTLTASAQSADTSYSCGTYGGGTYSNGDCPTGTIPTPDTNPDSSVTPPNTGFAKLMQPEYLLPIVGFLAAIVIGGLLVFKTRKHH